MKSAAYPLLSLGAPFLILIAALGLMQRQGNDQFQSMPALLVGAGLVLTGTVGRRNRRNRLLLALKRKSNQ